MERGRVKWFNDRKGYGFIEPEGHGEDIFVHQSNISADGFRSLREGDLVDFEIEENERGLTAVKVTKVSDQA